MADEKNQNDAVQDLLARLRSQMSQLDEMFGLESADTPAEEEAPTPAEASDPVLAFEALEETPSEENELTSDADDVPEAPAENTEEQSDESASDAPEAVASSVDPATSAAEPLESDRPEQIDFLASLVSEEAKTDVEPEDNIDGVASAIEEYPSEDAEDIPVFVREDAPVHVRKERIVAEETLAVDTAEEDDGTSVIVTEVEIAPDEPENEDSSRATLFVPNTVAAEESPQPSNSPFAPERRFDPSRYDEMLKAYDARKAAVVTPPEEMAPATPKPSLPHTPVLMPVQQIIEDEPEEVEPSHKEEQDVPVALAPSDVTESPSEDAFPSSEEELLADPAQEEPFEETAFADDDTTEPLPTAEDAGDTESTEDALPATEEEDAEDDLLFVLPEREPDAKENTEPPVQPMPSRTRIRQADPSLSDTARDLRTNAPSGRILLAPSAYRVDDDYVRDPKRSSHEEEEDYMGGLPEAIRDHLVGSPLGRPNRARRGKNDSGASVKVKKKKKKLLREFPEELEGKSINDFATDTIRHQLRQETHQTRLRLIVVTVLAILLLFLENISYVPFVSESFVQNQTAGVLNAILLLGIALAAWPRMYAGVKGLLLGRILPESLLVLEMAAAFVYAIVFGILGTDIMYFSFVPALGVVMLYCFRALYCETRRRNFEKLVAAGEKLVLSPTEQEKGRGTWETAEDKTYGLYRVRKSAAVDGFSERSSTVCEDERVNFVLLLASFGVGIAAFLISFLTLHSLTAAVEVAAFACFFTAPAVMMCGTHVYPMHRTDCVSGDDSAVVGESTVTEATGVRAIAFEDVEAAPSAGVKLSGVRVYCDDPTTVFRYLTALYGYIGGPLCGRFSGMYVNQNAASSALVELVDATKDGVSAAIDGAEILVGNGQYMTAYGIVPAYDAADERVLPDGKCGVLYVAVNGMICMKFYIEHTISPEFEHNVKRLYRHHIVAILRTYDPNFNDKTVSHSAVLRDSGVHVISKRREERADFYAERAKGGIVTAGNSAKLLSLLLLCFRTRSVLRFGRVYKIIGGVLGGALGILLCVMGLYGFVPSACAALYQLVLLGGFLLYTRLRIRLPDISKDK